MSDEASIKNAAKNLKAKLGNAKIYGLVNNAGILGDNFEKTEILNTNTYGPKWMTENFIPLINPTLGRIVNLGSGLGAGFVQK